jgi:hypothetical protein
LRRPFQHVVSLGNVAPTLPRAIVAPRQPFGKGAPSGSILTFESRMGFPTDSTCASLAHANRNIHRPQGC